MKGFSSAAGRDLHLEAWTLHTSSAAEAASGAAAVTEPVPSGVSTLTLDGRIVARNEANTDAALWIEPLLDGERPRLLIAVPLPSYTPFVDGRPAPRVGFLEIGSQLLLPGGRLLRLTVYNRTRIGAATPDQIGRRCVTCRTPIAEGSRVYTCPTGCVLHFGAADDASDAEPLECAKLGGDCPACRQPLVLKEGFESHGNDD